MQKWNEAAGGGGFTQYAPRTTQILGNSLSVCTNACLASVSEAKLPGRVWMLTQLRYYRQARKKRDFGPSGPKDLDDPFAGMPALALFY